MEPLLVLDMRKLGRCVDMRRAASSRQRRSSRSMTGSPSSTTRSSRANPLAAGLLTQQAAGLLGLEHEQRGGVDLCLERGIVLRAGQHRGGHVGGLAGVHG
jgi:hypothetical protein